MNGPRSGKRGSNRNSAAAFLRAKSARARGQRRRSQTVRPASPLEQTIPARKRPTPGRARQVAPSLRSGAGPRVCLQGLGTGKGSASLLAADTYRRLRTEMEFVLTPLTNRKPSARGGRVEGAEPSKADARRAPRAVPQTAPRSPRRRAPQGAALQASSVHSFTHSKRNSPGAWQAKCGDSAHAPCLGEAARVTGLHKGSHARPERPRLDVGRSVRWGRWGVSRVGDHVGVGTRAVQ